MPLSYFRLCLPTTKVSAMSMTLLISMLSATIAHGQAYPTKPIRIVTSDVGGGNDFIVRLIAPEMTAHLGQSVVIENRPSGVIPGSIVSKATPDGYTVLVYGGTFWLGPLLQSNVPYDILKDFAPITMLTNSPNILVVTPTFAATSVKELIALAKAKPGSLNYASTAPGSAIHLAAELFKSMAGVNIVRISYKGTGQAINDVIAGQVQMMFPNAASATQMIKTGRLKALAVTSAKPSALFPDLPTIAASGVPGYESGSAFGMFAPAKTPAAIIKRLNMETVRALNVPDIKEKFLRASNEVIGGTPEQLTATIKSETARVGKVVKEAGIRIE